MRCSAERVLARTTLRARRRALRQCGSANPDSGRFCEDCGAPLPAACPSCGGRVDRGGRFCGACGSPLEARGVPRQTEPRPADSGSPSLPEGEHKPVTVLFCDIVGSTALAERLGAEAMHELLGRFFGLALEEVERYGGTVNKFLGDGFMALVGVPAAHEDHARRAVLAALGLRERLRRDSTPAGVDAGSEVRMGLDTRLGRGREHRRRAARATTPAIGDTINVAARLQQLAEPGAILVSDATARLVAGYVRLEPLGPVAGPRAGRGRWSPTGCSGSGRGARPVDGPSAGARRRFVGRERQLAALEELRRRGRRGPRARWWASWASPAWASRGSSPSSAARWPASGSPARGTLPLVRRAPSRTCRWPTSCAPTAASPTATRPPRSRTRCASA